VWPARLQARCGLIMAGRILLRRQLLAAWEVTIRDHYQVQEINSERGLQVFFCGALLAMFADSPRPRRIFVEPRLRTSAREKGPMPDIVVCNSRAIIGVVELKYLPRATAKVDKDLDSLHWIAARSQSIRLDNRRYCGVPIGSNVYSLANDAVLCWAGVRRGLVKHWIHVCLMKSDRTSWKFTR